MFMQATPLQELYENTKGQMKRGAVAMAVQMQHEHDCTFSPNLQKPGVPQSSPVEAKLQLSSTVSMPTVRAPESGFINTTALPYLAGLLLMHSLKRIN